MWIKPPKNHDKARHTALGVVVRDGKNLTVCCNLLWINGDQVQPAVTAVHGHDGRRDHACRARGVHDSASSHGEGARAEGPGGTKPLSPMRPRL